MFNSRAGGGTSELLVILRQLRSSRIRILKKHQLSVGTICEDCSNLVPWVLSELGGAQADTDPPNKKT